MEKKKKKKNPLYISKEFVILFLVAPQKNKKSHKFYFHYLAIFEN